MGKRGLLIVFEGIDRCGKTTQCQLLKESLSLLGRKSEIIGFPDRSTQIGSLLDSYLKGCYSPPPQAVHLLFSANRWEAMPSMKEKLDNGTTLICDRYLFSGVAYSTGALELEREWCKQTDVGLIAPDAVVQLDIPVSASAERGGFGAERYEVPTIQSKVLDAYREFSATLPYWYKVDGSRLKSEIAEEVLSIVKAIAGNETSERFFS